MWRKGNLYALLAGIQINTVAMENSMEVLQTKKQNCHEINNSTSGYLPEINKNTNSQRFLASMLTAALFTKGELWR